MKPLLPLSVFMILLAGALVMPARPAQMAQWSVNASQADNPNAKAWIFYGDGRGGFTKTELSIGIDFHEAKVADVNGDGQVDIVNKPFIWDTPRIDVWLNLRIRE